MFFIPIQLLLNMESKYSNENNSVDYIYGRNPVIEALKSDALIDCIYMSNKNGTLAKIFAMAKERNITVKMTTDSKLTQMTDNSSHQGVMASFACGKYISLEELIEISQKKGTPAFIIMCDEIEDPHNLGAIIRTAEAAGADGIIIPKRRSASLNATVYKTSAGAASWLPVARVSNLSSAIETLKENNIWIYGTDATGENYTQTDLTGNVCLVIGSEGFGLGKRIAKECDFMLKLPMNGQVTSLNASVASGIFMYEVLRQRQIKG